jgi:hypothetical protein
MKKKSIYLGEGKIRNEKGNEEIGIENVGTENLKH